MTSMRKLKKSSRMSTKKRAKIAKEIESQVPQFKFKWYLENNNLKWPRFGGMCPWQAYGYYNDFPCYLRMRHDQASMTVYADKVKNEALLSAVIQDYTGDYDRGWLEDSEIVDFVKALIEKLAPPSRNNLTSEDIILAYVDAYSGKDPMINIEEKYRA